MQANPPPAWRPTPRDPRLHGLGSDHHHALVLARDIQRHVAAGTWDTARAEALVAHFRSQLEPHFAIEDDLILPALRTLGDATSVSLADRLAADHAALRALAQSPLLDDAEAALSFATQLDAHVRFEERLVFPHLQRRAPAALLDAVALVAPKPQRAPRLG